MIITFFFFFFYPFCLVIKSSLSCGFLRSLWCNLIKLLHPQNCTILDVLLLSFYRLFSTPLLICRNEKIHIVQSSKINWKFLSPRTMMRRNFYHFSLSRFLSKTFCSVAENWEKVACKKRVLSLFCATCVCGQHGNGMENETQPFTWNYSNDFDLSSPLKHFTP